MFQFTLATINQKSMLVVQWRWRFVAAAEETFIDVRIALASEHTRAAPLSEIALPILFFYWESISRSGAV